MQTPPAERAIDPRCRIVLHLDMRSPGTVFLRPMLLLLFESGQFFQDAGVFRIDAEQFRPGLHRERRFI